MKNNFQALPISQDIISKIGFSWNRSFCAVFIINNLNGWRYNSGTIDTKSLFRLSFIRSDKKMPLVGVAKEGR
jgi:hypothetical protein